MIHCYNINKIISTGPTNIISIACDNKIVPLVVEKFNLLIANESMYISSYNIGTYYCGGSSSSVTFMIEQIISKKLINMQAL